MTPKQKAAQLRYLFSKELDLRSTDKKVINCALIAVEEILKQFNKIKVQHIISAYTTYKDFEKNLISIQDQLDSEMISKWNYWNEVKHEIEKL